MKLNIFFRANESAKSAGSINKDITKESYRIGTHTKSDILKATWLSVNNSGVDEEDHITIFCDAVHGDTVSWMRKTLKTVNFHFKDVPPLNACPPFEEHPFPDLHPVRINCSKHLFELFYKVYSGNAAPVGRIEKSNTINSAVLVGCKNICP